MRLALAALSVVPWIGTPPPLPPAHPPLASPCRASQLKATLFLQGATGSLVGGVTLKNVSARPCALVGRPRMSFAGATSHWGVASIGRQREPYDVLAGPAGSLRAFAPGRTAAVSLWWSNWCGAPPRSLELALPGGGGTIALRSPGAPRCDQPSASSVLSVSPLEPVIVQRPASSRLPLAAAILGSGLSAHRGGVLSFVVRLTNTSRRPFSFGRSCPPYVVQVGERATPYLLNCRPVGTIPPRGSVRFAMKARVPARHRLGLEAFGWTLDPASWDAPQASSMLQVVP